MLPTLDMVIQTLGPTPHMGVILGLGSHLPHPTVHPILPPKWSPKYVFCHIGKANAKLIPICNSFFRHSSFLIASCRPLIPRWSLNHSKPIRNLVPLWLSVVPHNSHYHLPWGITFKTTKRGRNIPFGWRNNEQRHKWWIISRRAIFARWSLQEWCTLFVCWCSVWCAIALNISCHTTSLWDVLSNGWFCEEINEQRHKYHF